MYTDSSKYNHVVARSGRAVYLPPSPYRPTNNFALKVVYRFRLKYPFPDMRIVQDPSEK